MFLGAESERKGDISRFSLAVYEETSVQFVPAMIKATRGGSDGWWGGEGE